MRQPQAKTISAKYDHKKSYIKLMTAVLLLSMALTFISAFFFIAYAEEVAPNKNPELQTEASVFIDGLAEKALTVLRDKQTSRDEKITAFRLILNDGFDVPRISKIVLGRHVKKASKQQIADYNKMFPDFMLNFYFSKLQNFDEQNIDIISVIPQGKNDMYVRSRAQGELEKQPISVDWRVRPQADGGFKILDVKVEGISMVRTQRDDFTARVNADGVEGLVSYMKDIIENAKSTAEAPTTKPSGNTPL